ncbi:MAG: PD-(D/E)XK nuclease family protein [Candidatus Thorarchaeota archaeon]
MADFLAFQRCPIQYGTFKARKYEPALQVQLFYGRVVHEVLDRAHAHYRGLVDPGTRGTIPSSSDIEDFFTEVENSLRAQRISAVRNVREHALRVLQRFNELEGPQLYPRVLDTECRLQADQETYLLHGVVDVLARSINDSSTIEIWDYKGSKRPSIREPIHRHHVFQMQVYAELYRRKTNILPTQGIVYFLGELGGEYPPRATPRSAVMVVDFDPENIQSGMDEFGRVVENIEQCISTNTWPNPVNEPPGGTCVACDLRWNCAATRAFGNRYQLLYP